jgi:hypothetical protein
MFIPVLTSFVLLSNPFHSNYFRGIQMKFSVLFLAAMVAFASAGCGLANSDFFNKNYEIGKQMEATVGSEMIWKESGKRNDVYKNVLGGMRMELIYGGVANDVVKVIYREYDLGGSGSAYARPAFTQDLQYDMKQSKIITFKNTKIEVIAAANDKIIYKVLETPEPPAKK